MPLSAAALQAQNSLNSTSPIPQLATGPSILFDVYKKEARHPLSNGGLDRMITKLRTAGTYKTVM